MKRFTLEGKEFIEIDATGDSVAQAANEITDFINTKEYSPIIVACALMSILDVISEDLGLDVSKIKRVKLPLMEGGDS